MQEDDELYEELAGEMISRQPCRGVPHPAVLLVFSGVPGSGKTTLARKLAHDLQAQYINHDDIRILIRDKGLDPKNIFMPAISRLIESEIIAKDKNKLIVLDGSIDRTWKLFFKHAKEFAALPIIIRLDVSSDVIRSRLQARDAGDQSILQDAARHRQEFEDCCRQVVADLTLGETYDYKKVLGFLEEKLRLAAHETTAKSP